MDWGGVIVLIVGVILIIAWTNGWFNSLKSKGNSEAEDLRLRLRTSELEKSELKNNAEGYAIRLFNGYKEKEIENLKLQIAELARKEATNQLEFWKQEYTIKIRAEAIKNSSSIISGKVSEHFVPFITDFPFNAKEARFIGSPIDMVVFHGLDDEEYVTVYFLEIKTGNSAMNKRQRLIKDAVINGRTFWKEIKIEGMKSIM